MLKLKNRDKTKLKPNFFGSPTRVRVNRNWKKKRFTQWKVK